MKKVLSNENKKILKSTIRRIIITIVLGLVTSFLVNSLLRASLSDWDWSGLKEYLLTQKTGIFWLETGVLFCIYLWFSFLLRSRLGTASLFLTVSVGIAIANSKKMNVRGEPIYPSDFDMIKSLPELMRMIDIKFVIIFTIFVTVMLILSVLLMRKEWSQKIKFKNIFFSIIYFLFFLTLSTGIITIYNFNESENIIKTYFDSYANWTNFSQENNYRDNGFVSGFLYNLPGPTIEKPGGLTNDSIEKIVLEYTEIAKKENKFIKKQMK